MTHTIDQVGAAADAALSSLSGQKIDFFSALLSRDVTDDALYKKYNQLKIQLKDVKTFDALASGLKALAYENGDYSLQKVVHSALYPNGMTKTAHEDYEKWKNSAKFFITHIQGIEGQLNRVTGINASIDDIMGIVSLLNDDATRGVNLNSTKDALKNVPTSLNNLSFSDAIVKDVFDIFIA